MIPNWIPYRLPKRDFQGYQSDREYSARLIHNHTRIQSSKQDSEPSYIKRRLGRTTHNAEPQKRGVQAWQYWGVLAIVVPSFFAFLSGAPSWFYERGDQLLEGVMLERARAQGRELALATTNNSQTVSLLQAAKHIDPNPAKGGGEISVVENSALLAAAGPDSTYTEVEGVKTSPDQISLYIVREGDTLSQIAEMFNVSGNTIRWANDLDPKEALHKGQHLVILPVTGLQHTVTKDDTLIRIAKKYNADIEEIRQFNGLAEETKLAVGDVITIPGGEMVAPAENPSKRQLERQAEAPVRGTGAPALSGYFAHPLPGSRRTQGIHGYNGIDMGSAIGTPIHAAASGQVIVSRGSGWNGGYGNYIVIDHPNGTQTLYSHLSSNAVVQGASVAQGQVIGYVGATGKATGPHLHFEVRGAKNPF